MNETTSGAVAEATEELILLLAKAHRQWATNRGAAGLTEYCATHCAFRAILKTFPLEQALQRPLDIKLLEQFADSIALETRPLDLQPKVNA